MQLKKFLSLSSVILSISRGAKADEAAFADDVAIFDALLLDIAYKPDQYASYFSENSAALNSFESFTVGGATASDSELTTVMSQIAAFAEALPWSESIKAEASFIVTASIDDDGDYIDTDGFSAIFGTPYYADDYSDFYGSDFPEETGSYDDYYETASFDDYDSVTDSVGVGELTSVVSSISSAFANSGVASPTFNSTSVSTAEDSVSTAEDSAEPTTGSSTSSSAATSSVTSSSTGIAAAVDASLGSVFAIGISGLMALLI
ncbi:unnamed protein product [[Candida] boidinii]|uniref:Unnamed protein product n=1 Tax=Candida boidinii TaxID=5477 RepID=A0A9W6STM4_CANBO|nr:hypothetical protein B5S30_g2300 [[Candida] boidinii]GME67017.1 unnamed protein product [[Candida] boidinii]GMG14120.1 unnamed protein product [[Candida] boidinii]